VRASSCATCGEGRNAGLESHHVLLRSRGGDDVVANLVALCHSCHTHLHAGDADTRYALGEHLMTYRPDTLDYLVDKLGGPSFREFVEDEYRVPEGGRE